jgi:hypothetical protein
LRASAALDSLAPRNARSIEQTSATTLFRARRTDARTSSAETCPHKSTDHLLFQLRELAATPQTKGSGGGAGRNID